jgi:hypothetical protein
VSPRVLASVLIVAAAILQLAVAEPARRRAAALQAASAHAGHQAARLRAQIEESEAALAIRDRVARIEVPGAPGADDDLARLRRSMLRALDGVRVSDVALGVAPAPAPVATAASLRAEGSFGEVVRLATRMVAPGSGLILRKVRLRAPRDGRIALEVEGVGLARSK